MRFQANLTFLPKKFNIRYLGTFYFCQAFKFNIASEMVFTFYIFTKNTQVAKTFTHLSILLS